MSASNFLLNCALEYARRGLHVFPGNPRSKAPYTACDRDARGNKIHGTGGLYKATRDPELITAWWTKWPDALIMVRTGEVSGFWALDLDVPDASDPKDAGKPNGLTHWHNLKVKHGACPRTHTNVSPRGGKHLLFKWCADRPLGNGVGELKALGIDVRGNGGYVIFPPSRRSDGRSYEMEEPLDYFHFAKAPDWLYALIKPAPSISQRAVAAIRRPLTINSAARQIEGIIRTIVTTPEGERNRLLFWGACRLAELSQQSFLAHGDAVALAIEAGVQAGLTGGEISRTVNSAFGRIHVA
jgi:putative DNA primase/helicase